MAKNKIPKVPIIMQMEMVECGAASLAMILAYYGRWVPLQKMREDCGVSRDGSKAKNILQAARSYGLEAKGFRMSPVKIKEVKAPAIIFWQARHFVVYRGMKNKEVYLTDPAKGEVVVSFGEFVQKYSGICLEFQPTEAFEQGGEPKSVLNFIGSYISNTKSAFLFLGLAGAILTLVAIAIATFSQVFLDRLLSNQNPDWIPCFFLVLGVLFMIQLVISILKSLFLLKINGKLAMLANTRFVWHVLRLPINFFAGRRTGDIVSRQRANEAIAQTMIQVLAPVALNVMMLLFYTFAMISLSPILAVIGIVCTLLNIVLLNVITKKRMNISRLQQRDMATLLSETISGIRMVETLKAAGIEKIWFERFTGSAAVVNASNVKFVSLSQTLGSFPLLIQSLLTITVLVLGSYFVMIGNFTAGMLVAFQAFLTAFLSPMNELLSAGQSIQEMRIQMERIEDVMFYETDLDENVESLQEEEYEKMQGYVSIKNLSFGYSPLEAPLIENFSLELTPGKKIALVGGSGSGKSTIGKLIAGLYQPWSGEILYNGKTKEDTPNASFTGSLSVISQDITIFEGTVSDNIKMWDESIMDFEMILAAKDAQIHDMIVSREGGYRSLLQEDGKNLSGGERQRLEIARVLAGDPTIIIMDEATSALDAKTEFNVVNSIAQRNCTLVVVAHRLSTIRDCDEIIVLDKGKIMERGTHEELIELNGLYSTLVTVE